MRIQSRQRPVSAKSGVSGLAHRVLHRDERIGRLANRIDLEGLGLKIRVD